MKQNDNDIIRLNNDLDTKKIIGSTHKLDANKIIDTTNLLYKRISERFPKSGLSFVCVELHTIAQESQVHCEWIKKPHIMLRVGVGMVIVMLILILLLGISSTVDFSAIHEIEFADFFQVLDAGMNTVVLVGASLLFLVTFEVRKKRARAMAVIHQLRALAHVIDMHQLTKDPERAFSYEQRTFSSPKQTMNAFELTRYLDYCTEMLSLVSKVASLYTQTFDDTIVLTAVNELEDLTTGLSNKIWQKIMIIYRFKQ
ncbi:hypothetical protein QUF74_04780 [Candidatus Halobeggiatoa sp. HSG11]|nr:hypothetical protein [Candidatus Halobeggiatoa sp. HSG11]